MIKYRKKLLKVILFVIVPIIIIALILVILFNNRINKKIEVSKDGIHLYENINNGFTARFGYLYENKFQHLVQYELKSGEELTMQLLNTNSDIKAFKNTAKNEQNEDVDIIKFESVFNNVNAYYQITDSRIKEVILLVKSDSLKNFKYSIVTTGVTSSEKSQDDKTYVFKSGDKALFALPALFMKDAKGILSYEIETKITLQKEEDGNKYYLMEVIPDKDWLDDASRVYPIEIDPSILY